MEICVLGGGNGAYAAAGHLTFEGHRVRIFSPFPEELKPIKERGEIRIRGCLGEKVVTGIKVAEEIDEAVSGADLVMVVVPAIAHTAYAKMLSPVLEDGQILFIDPGHTGGALHMKYMLEDLGCKAQITLGETNTLTYIARRTPGNEVTIYKIASHIIMAALPAIHTSKVFNVIEGLYPGIKRAKNVLETSLTNLNAILHPPGMLLNAARIECTKGDFYFYADGTTPAVGKVMEELDRERMALLKAIGLPETSFLTHFYKGDYTTKDAFESGSYYRAVKESPPNKKIECPEDLTHRFLEEDIGRGLVPLSAIATLFGVETPLTDSLIRLASIVNEKDYWKEGLNLERLGFGHLSKEEVLEYVHGEDS